MPSTPTNTGSSVDDYARARDGATEVVLKCARCCGIVLPMLGVRAKAVVEETSVATLQGSGYGALLHSGRAALPNRSGERSGSWDQNFLVRFLGVVPNHVGQVAGSRVTGGW